MRRSPGGQLRFCSTIGLTCCGILSYWPVRIRSATASGWSAVRKEKQRRASAAGGALGGRPITPPTGGALATCACTCAAASPVKPANRCVWPVRTRSAMASGGSRSSSPQAQRAWGAAAAPAAAALAATAQAAAHAAAAATGWLPAAAPGEHALRAWRLPAADPGPPPARPGSAAAWPRPRLCRWAAWCRLGPACWQRAFLWRPARWASLSGGRKIPGCA
eukprot:scaffold118429_cov59-Phaeocystis_antarctica.AAC.7